MNAHPATEASACDASGLLIDLLRRNLPGTTVYSDFHELLDNDRPDAVVIATPSRTHATMVRTALDRGVHVFCEKPFCLEWQEALALADLAEKRGLVNQVGYHYRYVGAFKRMKEIVQSGALGEVRHILAEAYGPVVLRPRTLSWRTSKTEGGGCLYDYAAHPLNLLNWVFGVPTKVAGSALVPIFSTETDDQVLSTLTFNEGQIAQLSVNWTDESFRKMSTRIEMIGTNGRINVDRQECQLYLREEVPVLPGVRKGWSVQYTTELTEDPWFYLRGEEYSAQIADFVEAVHYNRVDAVENSFRSAAETDRTIDMIIRDANRNVEPFTGDSKRESPKRRRWFGRTKE